MYDGVHIWISGDKAAIVVNSFAMVLEPTPADLQSVVSRATFPVVLPVGLRDGTRLYRMMYAPADHPNTITLEYRNAKANFSQGISIVDSSRGLTNAPILPAKALSADIDHWNFGKETVLVKKGVIPFGDLNRIKAEMMQVSPTNSVAYTERGLRRFKVIGSTFQMGDAAERLAPQSDAVLLGRGQVKSVVTLAARQKPLFDARTAYLTHIPSVAGVPDYSKATLAWPKDVAVPANGVRAIAAVLRFNGGATACNCGILFTPAASGKFTLWRLPFSGTGPVQKYYVDDRTFAVTPLP
jgi:hypothetical protein